MEELFNSGVEEAILGLLLTDGYIIYDIKNKLSPRRFSVRHNELIYRAIESLADGRIEPNFALVKMKLEDTNLLDEAGGVKYLEYLCQHHENVKNIHEYVRRLNDDYKIRSLLSINAKIPHYLKKNKGAVNEVISQLDRELDDLIMEVDRPDVVLLSDAVDETFELILRKKDEPGIDGMSTGFTDIDHMTGGFLSGEIWYIGARPSHGKSAWLIKVALNVAKKGNPVLLFNREMSLRSIQQRMFAIVSGIPLEKIRSGNGLTEQDIKKLEDAKAELKELPIHIDSNFQGDIDYIIATIRKYHQLYGIKLVGVDYIGIVVERTAGEATHLLGAASRKLKLLSNELSITTIILSQMNRQCELRENKRPLMADLRQSGNLEEDADIMAALYREAVYNSNHPDRDVLEFIIRKARNGPIGQINLKFEDETVNIINQDLSDLWKDKKGFI